jgi:RNA polymerase-binding transcription factor DksA
MSTNDKVKLIEVPIAGKDGLVWNCLHAEREDICEVMLRDYQSVSGVEVQANSSRAESTKDWHRELLQARVRKIDDALDRLMSDSYGHCVKCGRGLKDTELILDPAIAFCPSCWQKQQSQNRPENETQQLNIVPDSNPSLSSSPGEFALETLQPFDTILVGTRNSDYRILLLDPRTGRALVEGGQYLSEPREALLSGSGRQGFPYKLGAIAVGYRLEMWIDEKAISTSPIRSVSIKHHGAADSIESITPAVREH